MARGVALSLLVLLLAAPARGDEPRRTAWWSEVRAWQQLAERWSSAEEPLVRAALARLAWEATAEDPAARRACERARAAGRRSAGGALFLTALSAAGPPPPIVPWAPGVAVEPEPVLTEASRVLALCARLDQEDGAACLAAWQAEADAPDVTGLEGVPAARARLAALVGPLRALGRPGPDVARVVEDPWWAGIESVGWVVGTTPRAFVVEDERGERELRPKVLRVTLDDQAVAALVQRRERLLRMGRRGFVDPTVLELGALAHDAHVAGRGWLAHALLVAADGQPGMPPPGEWERRLVARWAQRRLQEAGRRWRERATDEEVRALVEPVRSLGPLATRLDAEALAAALAPVERPAPPTWAEWEAAGREERLEELGRALGWGELDDPFPPDAPPGPDGRRPTVRSLLDDAGWSGIPLRVEHIDDRRLLRAPGPGPAGLLRVADVVRATPYGLGAVRGGRQLDGRGAAALAWWAGAQELGPAAWWSANLGALVDARSGSLRGLTRDLGQGATPLLLRELADRGPGARGSARRVRLLTLAAELEDGDLAGELLRAREEEEPRVALAGALGLARLEAGLVAPDAPRPALERLRSTARWLVASDAPAAVDALRALEPLDLVLAGELTRALGGRGLAPALARACSPGETLDRRLALCRLATLLDRAEEELDELEEEDLDAPDSLAAVLADWRARARRTPSPPGEVRELVAPWALEVLLADAPLWRDDPPRRDHAATTAVLLGPDAADALAARAGVDARAVAAARLTQSDRGAAAVARHELGRCTHLRAWLLGAPERRPALAVLDGPDPGARLWLGQAVAQAELPVALRTRAEALAGHDVTAGALVDLLRAWADDPSAPGALRLELRFDRWSPPLLELSVATPHDWPRCALEVRAGARALLRRTLDGAPATQAESLLRAGLQALSERARTGACATLVATR